MECVPKPANTLMVETFDPSKHPPPVKSRRKEVEHKSKNDMLWDDYDISPLVFATRSTLMMTEIIEFATQLLMRVETLVKHFRTL